MIEFTQYFGRVQGFRGQLTGLPAWARFIVAIFALPGIVLAGLSLLGFLVSILALLLLAAPMYIALKRLTTPTRMNEAGGVTIESSGTRRVESTIID